MERDPSEISHVPRGEGFNLWSERCYTERYNPTVAAVSELADWQLEDLMLQLEYTWDDEANEWRRGRNSVSMSDVDGANLPKERVHALDKGSAEADAVYEITTVEFATPQSAYAALVSEAMTSVDVATVGGQLFGAAQTLSGDKLLVVANELESGDGVHVQVFSEQAIAGGLFDKRFTDAVVEAGGTYGSTVDEVFLAHAGWFPGQLGSGESGEEFAGGSVAAAGPNGKGTASVDGSIYLVSRNGEPQPVGFREEPAVGAARDETITFRGQDYELVGTVTFYDDSQEVREYSNAFASRLAAGEILIAQSQGSGMTAFGRYAASKTTGT